MPPGPLAPAGAAPRRPRLVALPAGPDAPDADEVLVGVLALQGGFDAHGRLLRALDGVAVREVRVPADLEGLDALVLPGGESTTMTLGIEREGLAGPLRDLAAAGTPLLATCAGLILLDREHLAVLDYRARRNAFGRQVRSFEADLELPGVAGPPMRAAFIRAPWIEEPGEDVELLAAVDGHPVAARQGAALVVAFHPELTGDDRLHRDLVARARTARAARAVPPPA